MFLFEHTLASIQFRYRLYDWIKYRLDVMTSLKVINIFKPYIYIYYNAWIYLYLQSILVITDIQGTASFSVRKSDRRQQQDANKLSQFQGLKCQFKIGGVFILKWPAYSNFCLGSCARK